MKTEGLCPRCGETDQVEEIGGARECVACGLRSPAPATVWMTAAHSCIDCGGNLAVRLTSQEPDDATYQAVEQEIGGMNCIRTFRGRAAMDGIPVELERVRR